MKRILPWFVLPLLMAVFCFGFECLINGVDFGISREGDCIKISVTNNTWSCAALDWSNTLLPNDWHWYRSVSGPRNEPAASGFSFLVRTNEQRTFFRLRDCNLP